MFGQPILADIIRHGGTSGNFKPYWGCNKQAFTNCMHGYDHAHNMHANGVTCALKFAHSINWEHDWELLIACLHRPLCFKKIKTTTSTAFAISNAVVLNP